MGRIYAMLLVCVSMHAIADPTTIGGFRAECIALRGAEPANPDEVINNIGGIARCIGYVSGLIDGFRATTGIVDIATKSEIGSTQMITGICPPNSGMSIEQQIAMLDSYARKNGYGDGDPTRSAFILALRENFPCGGHDPHGDGP